MSVTASAAVRQGLPRRTRPACRPARRRSCSESDSASRPVTRGCSATMPAGQSARLLWTAARSAFALHLRQQLYLPGRSEDDAGAVGPQRVDSSVAELFAASPGKSVSTLERTSGAESSISAALSSWRFCSAEGVDRSPHDPSKANKRKGPHASRGVRPFVIVRTRSYSLVAAFSTASPAFSTAS